MYQEESKLLVYVFLCFVVQIHLCGGFVSLFFLSAAQVNKAIEKLH